MMDGEPQALQFLGVCGIYRESFRIISKWRKLFLHISLALILPLSILFLSHSQISNLISTQINHNEGALRTVRPGSDKSNQLLHSLSSNWAFFLAFKAAYLLLTIVFSLLSTAAVIYAIAGIHISKEMTFKKVVSVVPKVWKRLMVTFLWTFLVVLGYNTLTALLIILPLVFVGHNVAGVVAVVLLIFYIYGLLYVTVVWHVASVVSVVEEDVYGLAAMQKSIALIGGNTWVAISLLIQTNAAFVAIHLLFGTTVLGGRWIGLMVLRVGFGFLFLILLTGLILLGLVIQTVLYFVCKAYHQEYIDKSGLANYLGLYSDKYVTL